MRTGCRMSRLISASHIERKLRSIVGVSGSNPLPDLIDVLGGLIVLECERPEWRLAGGDNMVVWGAIQAGQVGNFTYMGVRNPPASGVLAVVQTVRAQVGIAGGATVPCRAGVQAVPFDVLAGEVVNQSVLRDFRSLSAAGGAGQGATQTVSGNTSPVGGFQILTGVAAGSNLVGKNDEINVPGGLWVIPPGVQIRMVSISTNAELSLDFEGYERPLEGDFDIR